MISDEKLRVQLHAAVRKVLQHHKLTTHGDGVVEADLIDAMLTTASTRQTELADALKAAYFDGRYSMATYNDVEVSDPNEDFAASMTANVINQLTKES